MRVESIYQKIKLLFASNLILVSHLGRSHFEGGTKEKKRLTSILKKVDKDIIEQEKVAYSNPSKHQK